MIGFNEIEYASHTDVGVRRSHNQDAHAVMIAKDGYETLDVEQRVRSPWYELPGLDFISENLIPWTIRDVRYYRYVMQRSQVRTPEQVLGEAKLLKDYGMTIGEPAPQFTPPPPTGTVLLPPTP